MRVRSVASGQHELTMGDKAVILVSSGTERWRDRLIVDNNECAGMPNSCGMVGRLEEIAIVQWLEGFKMSARERHSHLSLEYRPWF